MVTFSGMLEMGSGYLPVTSDWDKYIERSDSLLTKLVDEIQDDLLEAVQSALSTTNYENDPWLKHLDWTIPKPNSRKTPKNIAMAGQPTWYRDLWDPKLNRIRITPRQRTTPYLLKLTWKSFPIYHSKEFGWTFAAPKSFKTTSKKLVDPSDPTLSSDPDTYYYRLPHTDGESRNCGNPLGKSFHSYFTSGTLSSSFPGTRRILENSGQITYWTSARSRITSQFVVWDESTNNERGVILPQTIPMGTITRRAVEPLWMTAANAKSNSIGSELKAQVKSVDGWIFVGADVDSEELWIASLYGDAALGIHGGTPLGYMTLQGSRSEGTDMHSVTAKILGIERNAAKVFNYARIYGAGPRFAENLLKQFSPTLTPAEIKLKAEILYRETKGTRVKNVWVGGTESFTFNQLEFIARLKSPKTPALSCAIPDGLEPPNQLSINDYLKSRINWSVQSSGVDYLHLLLVSMQYLSTKMSIPLKFILSIHDEVRFMVPEQFKYKAALAMQLSNLWTRAFFVECVGMTDLPLSCAFFSTVDIDHCLRKEVTMDCKTPTNKTALSPGSSLTISELLTITGPTADFFIPDDEKMVQLTLNPPQSVLERAKEGLHLGVLSREELKKVITGHGRPVPS